MGVLKRLCLFVFALAGLSSLVALSLTWVGPWTAHARAMLEVRWYFTALEVLVCISGIGLLACLCTALFSPRTPRETVVAEVPGGEITVTRAAIIAQAKHVIEADGTCEAAAVHVRMRKRGHVRVNVRVRPYRPVDVIERGAELYSELDEGLAKVCGESVESIGVVFTDPNEFGGGVATQVETSSRSDSAMRSGDGREIVVSMSGTTSEATEATATTTVTESAEGTSEVSEQLVAEPEATEAPVLADEPAEKDTAELQVTVAEEA